MVEVVVRDNDVERAMRRLKKDMNREGIFREMRDRRYHTKPFEIRKRAKLDARRRAWKNEQRRQQDM